MFKKIVNNIIGILLLPLTVSAVASFFIILFYLPELTDGAYYFIGGMALCTITRKILPKAAVLYILGHELTHALWCKLFGGKVYRINVSAEGGSMQGSVSNVWVKLAPYFFPIYTVIVGLFFGALALFFDMLPYYNAFIFLLGFSLQFHYLYTGDSLKIKQSDIHKAGVIISAAIIPLINVAVIVLLLQLVIPEMSMLKSWYAQTYRLVVVLYGLIAGYILRAAAYK